jgi:hypothetical protein
LTNRSLENRSRREQDGVVQQEIAMSRLWILPVLWLITVLRFACGAGGDDKPQSVSSTAPTATLATSGSPSPTVPPDWATYVDASGLFTARYPSAWFAADGTFSTFKSGSVGPTFPPGAVKIDVGAIPVAQIGSCATPSSGAISTTVDGQPSWSITKDGSSPDVQESVQVFVQRGAYCFGILALFGNGSPDHTPFDEFLNGLRLGVE